MVIKDQKMLREAMDLVAGDAMEWLRKKGMFENENCPSDHVYMSEDEWEELKSVMYNAILSF